MSYNNNQEETLSGIRPDFLICLFLCLITLAVYWPVTGYDFVKFDDNVYVTENRHIQNGLTSKSIAWSFSFGEKAETYWHPLTWLSHSLDCQMYGLNAGMHHLTSLIIHVLNSMLLFLVFKRMTGALWKSAFVAALFALHPINVDSVAWVAERKNVLSAFFWMLTMLTYTVYCERPGLRWYLLSCLAFAFGLLAKPMLVTLPCVLLLLDYWPLGRIRNTSLSSISRVVMEKLPLFFLSGVSIYLSTISVKGLAPIISMDQRPMPLRIANALVSYGSYIIKLVWPQDLAIYYPYPNMIPFWKVGCAGLFLIVVSGLVLLVAKRRPYLTVGWFWFFGTLVPVIGLVQPGLWPAMADRWAYIPFIGLFVMIAWGIGDLVIDMKPIRQRLVISVAATLIIVITPITFNQIRYWKNSISLFEHALDVVDDNDLAHYNLALTLAGQGKIDEAVKHFSEAVRINPASGDAQINLGGLLLTQGHIEKALIHLEEGLKICPNSPEAHLNMGTALASLGRPNEAISHLYEALRLNPGYDIAHYTLGQLLTGEGKIDEAIIHFNEALRFNPASSSTHIALGSALAIKGEYEQSVVHLNAGLNDTAKAQLMLGNILLQLGNDKEAVVHYSEAIKINPNSAEAHTNLGYALLAQGKEDDAVKHCLEAIRLDPDKSLNAYYNLACIYARQNNVDESVKWLKKAVDRGFNDWKTLKADKDLENIKNTAYYTEITNAGKR